LFTGDDGHIVSERRFEPFGVPIDALRETSTGTVVGAVDFAALDANSMAKRTDPATGWSYHGARWMAPSTGRWLTPDPPVKAPDPKFLGRPWSLHPYQYVDQNPTLFWDPDGNSPFSIIAKEAGKRGIKKVVKEYIESRIKTQLKRLGDRKFQKAVLDDAADILDSFSDPWYMTAIELVPVVGDAVGAARFYKKYQKAFDRLERLERKVNDAIMRGEHLGKGAFGWARKWTQLNTDVGKLPRFSGRSRDFIEKELRDAGFTPDPSKSTHWIKGRNRVRIDDPHKPSRGPDNGGFRGDVETHYHKEYQDDMGAWHKLDDNGTINGDPNRTHIFGNGK
jgi:RHS repeat-associated protein